MPSPTSQDILHFMSGPHCDHPTLTDLLDRDDLIKEVANQIETCRPPHVIGVYGDWGSGKTSFLRQIQLYLSGTTDCIDYSDTTISIPTENGERQPSQSEYEDLYESKLYQDIQKRIGERRGYQVVWFDAWRYQHEPAPIVALLQEIRRHFSPGAKAYNFIKKGSADILSSAILAMGQIAGDVAKTNPLLGFAMGFVGSAKAASRDNDEKSLSMVLATDQIRNQLKYAISTITDSLGKDKYNEQYYSSRCMNMPPRHDNPRLIIVIDDLDRCEPETALRLLEGIKIYLDIPQCVFVIGMNPKMLIDFIASKYENAESDGSVSHDEYTFRARDYLDKIITNHYTLGISCSQSEFLSKLMPDLQLEVNGVRQPYKKKVSDILCSGAFLPPNPRRIKGFLNTLVRYESVHWKFDPDPKLIVVFGYLNHFHPDIMRLVQFYPDFADNFVKWCKTADAIPPFESLGLSTWAPAPSDDDIRPRDMFVDPIHKNVLHITSLLKDFTSPKDYDHDRWKQYVLLR